MALFSLALPITGIVTLILLALWGARRLDVIGVPARQRTRRVVLIPKEPPPASFAAETFGTRLPHSDRRMLTPRRSRAVIR